jgi:hypothetical protein
MVKIDLNIKAQEKAIQDYNDGWLESHADDLLTQEEIREILSDIESDSYNLDGVLNSFN